MAGDRQRRDIGDDPAEDSLDRGRLAVADRVGEEDRIRACLGDLDRNPAYAILVDRPLDRAAKRGGEPAGYARAALGRGSMAERHDATEILDQLGRSAADIGTIVSLVDRQYEHH